jgi:hypothetical protein
VQSSVMELVVCDLSWPLAAPGRPTRALPTGEQRKYWPLAAPLSPPGNKDKIGHWPPHKGSPSWMRLLILHHQLIPTSPSWISIKHQCLDLTRKPLIDFRVYSRCTRPPQTSNHKRQHQSWIIFHVQSSVQLSTIRQKATIATLLSQTKG